MNKKETPRSPVAREAGQSRDNLSNFESNINDNKSQDIFALLPTGEDNAISSKMLARMVGATSVRELQHRVAAERESGALILSTCKGGYFKPQDGAEGQAEISRFVATLRNRALNTLRALKAAKVALAQAEGQITLDELEGL